MIDLQKHLRIVPDFPKKGIRFWDITTLLKNAEAFQAVIDELYKKFEKAGVDYVAAIESRGYLIGAPLAYKLKCGLVVIRKPGKLPAEVEKIEYDLEYGKDVLEIHKDSIEFGKKVLVVDDLLATGGTAAAACQLVEKVGGKISTAVFLIELAALNGRKKLPKNVEVVSLLKV